MNILNRIITYIKYNRKIFINLIFLILIIIACIIVFKNS